MSQKLSACKGCGAALVWAKNKEGKLIPLDASAPTYVVEMDLLGEQQAVRASAYVSHFSTCPKAQDFSASRRTS